MKKVIRADLRRILRKPKFYILMVIHLVLLIALVTGNTAAEMIENEKYYLGLLGIFVVFIPTFLGLYSDEIKSGNLINLIGRGLSRRKIIIAKIIDAAIIYLAYFTIAFIGLFIKNSLVGLAITPRQNLFLLVFCLSSVLRGVGFSALASLLVFATWSPALSMTVMIIVLPFSKLILERVQDKINLPIYTASFEGLLDSSYASFQAGSFGWQLIPALIYLCVVVFLTVLIFNRKELEL